MGRRSDVDLRATERVRLLDRATSFVAVPDPARPRARPRRARTDGPEHRPEPGSSGKSGASAASGRSAESGAGGREDGAELDGQALWAAIGAPAVSGPEAGPVVGGSDRYDQQSRGLSADELVEAEDADSGAWAVAEARSVVDAGTAVGPKGPGPQAQTSAGRMRARRPFGRPQLAVVGCLVALALLLAGWAVLRARPVALAAPVHVAGPSASDSTASQSGASASAAAASGSPTATPSADPAGGSPPAPTGSTVAAGSPKASATAAGAEIEVHVLGAVRRPGLKRLSAGARVADAIDAAGGLRHANPGRLNLAQPLSDGQQLFLARSGRSGTELRAPETSTGSTPAGGQNGGADPGASAGSGSSADSGSAGSTGAAGATAKINLNQATATQLDELPGVGPVTAGKIIAWREQHGHFTRIEELQEVDGIGPKTYADLAPGVTV